MPEVLHEVVVSRPDNSIYRINLKMNREKLRLNCTQSGGCTSDVGREVHVDAKKWRLMLAGSFRPEAVIAAEQKAEVSHPSLYESGARPQEQ
ncbi:hypothetical protein ACC848_05680 [Rhizobium johnstonii]|uniref:hypothetical protein n=1 Tax=Rhizobium johnstonii TaxID=3019933 RepID=UPI003F97FF4A